ncbi:MAG: hypothetical protein P8090_16400 [Gammaproteobacteria bacterium]
MIARYDGGRRVAEDVLWYELGTAWGLPQDADADSYLRAVLLDAMSEKRDICVQGTASKTLVRNLVELQSAWHRWLPDTFHTVSIDADELRDRETPKPGAVSAFSLGVDSMFTVWRHTQRKLGNGSIDIRLGVLTHGFDIPLSATDAFEKVRRTAAATLDELGLPLADIKTNFRQISHVNWEYTFGSALVAALGNFKEAAGTGLVGSSNPYNALVLPWGSNPVTDHLLSAGDFAVVHDGASHNRPEKISEIANWETGCNNLRVCWEGKEYDRNCGKCEKCLRTMLNFLACGRTVPSCFSQEENWRQNILRVRFANSAIRSDWVQILQTARINQIKNQIFFWLWLMNGI